MTLFIEITGYIGFFLIVFAYLALTQQWWTNGALYQSTNAVGSAFLLINAVGYHSIPLSILQIVWIIIALSWFTKKGNQMNSQPIAHWNPETNKWEFEPPYPKIEGGQLYYFMPVIKDPNDADEIPSLMLVKHNEEGDADENNVLSRIAGSVQICSVCSPSTEPSSISLPASAVQAHQPSSISCEVVDD